MAETTLASTLSITHYHAAQRRRATALVMLVLVASLLAAGAILLMPVVPPLTLLTWGLLALIAWQPRIGLCVAFGMVVLFEDGRLDQLMLPGAYFYGGLGNWVGLGGILPSPLEVLLLLTTGSWLAAGIARRRLDFRGGRLHRPMLLFLAALLFGVLRGIVAGAALNYVLWECRFLFYAVICYFLAANTVRRWAHVRHLITILLIAATLFAVEGAYRKIALIDPGRLGVIPEFAYSHETVIFLGTLLLVVVAQQTFGAPRWQRFFGLGAALIGGYTLLATERRAGFIALLVAFLALAMVLSVTKRKAFIWFAVPALVAFAIYLPLFWNNTGTFGQPARAVRSLYQPDPRDAASNLDRELEKINIQATIHANPLLGVGFGREFLFVVGMPDMSWWPLWHYEPHNNVFWIWLKTGLAGFICFLTLMGCAIARAAHTIKSARLPEARVFGVLTLSALTSALVFSYVDLSLTGPRIPVLIGTVMGTLAVLDDLST